MTPMMVSSQQEQPVEPGAGNLSAVAELSASGTSPSIECAVPTSVATA